MQDEEFNLKLI